LLNSTVARLSLVYEATSNLTLRTQETPIIPAPITATEEEDDCIVLLGSMVLGTRALTEFAGRHELYERNYSGGWEDIRAQVLTGAQRGGGLREMEAMVEQCMAEYDTNGWTVPTWINP
jgi:hypothetical protein